MVQSSVEVQLRQGGGLAYGLAFLPQTFQDEQVSGNRGS